MPLVAEYKLGKLICAIERRTGEPYDRDNWRTVCTNGQGVIVFLKSVRKFPGQTFVYFAFAKDDRPIKFYEDLRTGYGEILHDGETSFVFRTPRTDYCFEYENTIADDRRIELIKAAERMRKNQITSEEEKDILYKTNVVKNFRKDDERERPKTNENFPR